jgi:hypothetical protein
MLRANLPMAHRMLEGFVGILKRITLTAKVVAICTR